MMDAVKRGGDRQELHERIRVHSMEAGRVIKQEGGENPLLELIAADPIFGTTLEELKALIRPENFVGRAPQQVDDFLREEIAPILEKYKDDAEVVAEVNV